ncbi:hypothetical protein EV424DRAFT_1584787 [Suillus variegatus]|nr:hypothetical protein EV424DRAFT_1584787 [Suillus variegatus]
MLISVRPGSSQSHLASTLSPNTYSHRILTSKASSTNGAEDKRAHTDEQPASEQNTPGPPQDSDPNTGLSQSSKPREQENTSKAALDDNLPPQTESIVAEKDQPNPSLNELTRSLRRRLARTIGPVSGGVYKRVAEEHDDEFLERYTTDMDIILIFSGLFSAVSTPFIVAMESDLSPGPSDTTNALLKQLVRIGLDNLTQAGPTPKEPSTLSMSLLTAFGAAMGKQYCKSNKYSRSLQEEQGKRRQEKFDGLTAWYFDGVVQSFPVLLQISLLLFRTALGAKMWCEQSSIAWVIISTTDFGFLFYSLTVMACLISPACPFQTHQCRRCAYVAHRQSSALDLRTSLQTACCNKHLQVTFLSTLSQDTQSSSQSTGPVRATGAFARRSLQLFFAALHKGLRSLVPHSSTEVVDSEAQPLDLGLDVLAENDDTLTLDFPDVPSGRLEAPSVMWLLKTSTDPEAFLTAARLIPQVEWPLDFDVSDMLHQLFDTSTHPFCLRHRSQKKSASRSF